jgi:hypothetical protein
MWGVQRSHGARSLISEWRLNMKLRWERLPELVHTHTHLNALTRDCLMGVVEYRAGPLYPWTFPRTPLS